MTDRLRGKVAVITGAGSGMGLATARRFHAEGARLVLTDISGAEQETAEELGEGVVAVTGDIADADDVRKVMDLAVDEFGGFDILANIAGAMVPMVPLVESPLRDFDKMIHVNLRGVFLMMRAAVPHLIERGGGSIVNIASTAALIGTPNLAGYSAAKSGVLGLTRSVALEYADRGIRVNVVAPGTIRTPMMEKGLADNPAATEHLTDMVPMRRLGTADDIAEGVLFLAGDESSYITGIALPIDGGQTAG